MFVIVRFYTSAISTSAVFVQSFFWHQKRFKIHYRYTVESELLSILCLKASQDSQLWKVMVTVWLTHMAISRSTVVRLCETCRSSMLEEHSSRSDQMLMRQRPCMAEDCCLCCYATWHGVVPQKCSRVTCTILVSSQKIPNTWWVPLKECVPRAFCQNKLVSAFFKNSMIESMIVLQI